jgi:hypothetical protein
MHRPVFLMIVWALFTGKVFGQGTNTNACHLTPAQFPTVRGLRLGMTPDQVLNLLPPDPDKGDLARQAHSPNTYDVTSLEYVPNKHGNPPEFMGVARIFMFFYRGQLADFGVDYTPPHEGAWFGATSTNLLQRSPALCSYPDRTHGLLANKGTVYSNVRDSRCKHLWASLEYPSIRRG